MANKKLFNYQRRKIDLKKYFKTNIILPLFFGVLSGGIFLFYPSIDDTPILSLYMLFSCVMLLYLGIHNINIINNKIKSIIILPLFFGGFVIYGILSYAFKGVFIEPPGLILFGVIIGIILLLIGSVNLIKMLKNNIFKRI
ncbi:hypothetical protein [Methanobrevibacter curvatus]|uniref:Uncharacterized protein n=1 Tax=Methanobrevibacter curvatus TaxID=49547 RepID=A0A166DT93_9EURY|nr:hypothetical protein [Methanobrevibacter curvatus]KZX15930.1 hypothetical protein MBCUR_01750 [Methanobrevibacter curvatus]